ncbi:MAG TPA: GAF domain-containing protein [Ilumatobacteraceae bacterium]|nr:GAF domain-containing protein [Ilumatobacteraceae bacterium]HUV19598.1 GAF domain-containing protein [Ilumatobacteraceae bacterium]
MQVTFWGTRGSIAKAGSSTLRFGGNTSCVSIRSDAGTQLVIDCGTGAHGLGQHLLAEANGAPIDGHILISHTHWDHIQGLPFFAPLFGHDNTWHIFGPSGLGGSLGDILAGQMEYRYFPVEIGQLSANVEHHDLVEGVLYIDDVAIVTRFLNHPALTLGYRVEVDGAVVVYSSDHEPHDQSLAVGGDMKRNRHDEAHTLFVTGADLLIHDAQYLGSEYPDHIGWGHSTVEYVVDLASAADVKRVALYHHDPNRTDDQVDDLVELARGHARRVGYDGEIFAAAEGVTVEVRGDRVPSKNTGRAALAAEPSAVAERPTVALVVAQTSEVGDALAAAARAEALEVIVSGDLHEAFAVARSVEPGIVLIEPFVDDGGFDLVTAIRALGTDNGTSVPIIMVGHDEARFRPDAAETRITEWLVWPASPPFLRTKLRAWLLRRASRWQNAPLPDNEGERLAALYGLGVLDTAPEARFDRHTEDIAAILDVPIALVSLVDADRQWFKSRRGIDVEETPREMSLCAHAILGADVLQVEDTLADDRFAENPLVSGEPRLRFYAGMPLALDDGSRVGTLCVADYLPRHLDDDQLDSLRRVAAQVVQELQHR